MSQNKVYDALEEIGGEGTTAELREHISSKFPDSTLPDYATDRLRKLEEKDVVEIDETKPPYYVKIMDEDWNRVPESLCHNDFPPASEDN